MSDFAITLAEEGDTSSSLRSRNLEGEDFRQVLITQGNHGPTFIARAEIMAVASGTLRKHGPPATMVVFRFTFLTLEKGRFVSAKIKVEFSDTWGRGNMDPEVFAISPDGEDRLDIVNKPKDVEKSFHVSVAPINSLDIGFEWKISQTKEKEYWAKQQGIKFNSRTTFTGSDNMAIWQLSEHTSKKHGIPSFFQTAVLLQRRGSDKIAMNISIESEIDILSSAKLFRKRLFGGVATEPVDPVNISPKMFKMHGLNGVEQLKEGHTALESMEAINMREFTGVEKRFAGKQTEGGDAPDKGE
ncbi:hypothetical protein F4803DRAFT_378194 [Xylaria telfairii]|nr:hypothetical protein F4803DRAFT_378194 [Xylaria telfairii]